MTPTEDLRAWEEDDLGFCQGAEREKEEKSAEAVQEQILYKNRMEAAEACLGKLQIELQQLYWKEEQEEKIKTVTEEE